MASNDTPHKRSIDQQRNLWDAARRISRNRIGPIQHKSAEESFVGANAPTEPSVSPLDSLTARFVEYQVDGIKTSTVMSDTLYQHLVQAQENRLEHALALQTVLAQVQEMLKNPSSSFSLAEMLDVARWSPPGLAGWLRNQRDFVLQDTALSGFLPDADACFPFVVYERDQDEYSLSTRASYWRTQGLNAQLLPDPELAQSPNWDAERRQLTLQQPYILFCSGNLTGSDWLESFRQRVAQDRIERPSLIIFADDVSPTLRVDTEGIQLVIFPAPSDHVRTVHGVIPERPRMREMAHLFGTTVADIWDRQPGEGANWSWSARSNIFGRCEVAQVDRFRTVLVSNQTQGTSDPRRSLDWFQININVLTLPVDRIEDESLPAAEKILRQRIEASSGLVAGTGSVFYWIAQRLDGDSAVVQWMREALRQPMLQILENANIFADSDPGRRITEWVVSSDRPMHTFFIDVDRVWELILRERGSQDRFSVIANDPPIILGDARYLGIVVPRLQAQRVVDEATNAALQLSIMHSVL